MKYLQKWIGVFFKQYTAYILDQENYQNLQKLYHVQNNNDVCTV